MGRFSSALFGKRPELIPEEDEAVDRLSGAAVSSQASTLEALTERVATLESLMQQTLQAVGAGGGLESLLQSVLVKVSEGSGGVPAGVGTLPLAPGSEERATFSAPCLDGPTVAELPVWIDTPDAIAAPSSVEPEPPAELSAEPPASVAASAAGENGCGGHNRQSENQHSHDRHSKARCSSVNGAVGRLVSRFSHAMHLGGGEARAEARAAPDGSDLQGHTPHAHGEKARHRTASLAEPSLGDRSKESFARATGDPIESVAAEEGFVPEVRLNATGCD